MRVVVRKNLVVELFPCGDVDVSAEKKEVLELVH